MTDTVFVVSGTPDPAAANPIPPTLQDALAAGFAYRNAAKTSADAAAGHATDAQASAATATGAAEAASDDAVATAADRAAVSADKLTVEQQKDAVTVIRGEIAAYTAVAQQAATDAANAATDADQVHVDRLAADASAGAAQVAAADASNSAASAAATLAGSLLKASNLSDLTSALTARSNLGLGDAATKTVGTAVGNVVSVQTGGKLPALDGSQLTNVSSNRVLISVTDAVSAASVDFTGLSSTYEFYEIEYHNVTQTSGLWFRTSSDNGVTFDAGATDYAWAFSYYAASATGSSTSGDSKVLLTANVNATGGASSGRFKFANHASTNNKTVVGNFGKYDSASPITAAGIVFGTRLSATAVNAIRFLASSGNISGTFMLFGVKR